MVSGEMITFFNLFFRPTSKTSHASFLTPFYTVFSTLPCFLVL